MKKAAFLMVFPMIFGCTRIIIPNEESTIILQQPVTREVFYCESTSGVPADICAAELEENGFVRLTDKPTFTGKDDIPQKGSYPTRRYRDKQDVPRW